MVNQNEYIAANVNAAKLSEALASESKYGISLLQESNLISGLIVKCSIT